MKKILLSLGVVLLSASAIMAQDKKHKAAENTAATAPATTLKADNMDFTK